MTRTLSSRWVLLVLLLLLVKGSIVLSLGDVFFYGEELEKGTAAKAMIDGIGVPHHQLAYHYYEGGGFVVSHCIAVAFLLVGQNLLALKLVALAFQLTILIVGCWATVRLFGRVAGTAFGLLFVFGPASVQKLSLLALGVHFEAGLFLLAALALGARVLFATESTRRDWFVLGLVTGFGIYFSYLVLLMAVWLTIMLLVVKPKTLVSASGLALIAGGGIGLIPWLAMVGMVGSEVWNVHGIQLLSTSPAEGGIGRFSGILHSLFYSSNGELSLTVCARVAMFTLGLGYLLFSRRDREVFDGRRKRTLFVTGFMALFLATLLVSQFVPGQFVHHFAWLRFVPFWLIGIVIVSAAIGGLWGSGQRIQRGLAGVLLSAMIGMGMLDTREVIAEGSPGQIASNWEFLNQHKGYSYPQYFEKVLPHLDGSPKDKLEVVEWFQELDTGSLRASAVKALLAGAIPESDPSAQGNELRQAIEIIESSAGTDVLRLEEYKQGVGQIVVKTHGWNRVAAVRWARTLHGPDRAAALEALGRFGWMGYPSEMGLRKALRRVGGQADMEPYIRGLGHWAYPAYRLDPASFEAFRASLPEPVARDLFFGFEGARASQHLGSEQATDRGLASY
jgi:hypothetical protein